MKKKESLGSRLFDVTNITLQVVICLVVLVPFLHVLAGSLSSIEALMASKVTIWPVGLNFNSYDIVINDSAFWRSFRVSVFITVVGTALNMLLTVVTAYPLSKGGLVGRKQLMLFVVFTIIFSAPMIPTFLVVKSLGLVNTLWALIFPSAFSAFNMILCLTFFRGLPEELFEAAKVDGMSEYGNLFRIALPLSLPILVTLILYYAVGHWNTYSSAIIYITDVKLQTLQVFLYNIVNRGNTNEMASSVVDTGLDISPESIKMATIVVATLPIMLIYPFIQKHFIKGSLVGSVKG